MPKNVYERLGEYYTKVGAVLRGEAGAASIFPNTSDIGTSREKIYASFLAKHAPSKCQVLFGGFLFDLNGAESKQMGIIVTTDTTPRFDFHNSDGSGKSFSHVEGTLAVVSVKSTLDKSQLIDALYNIASIPPTLPLKGRTPLFINIKDYDDWPLKMIYATNGLSATMTLEHLRDFLRKIRTFQ